MQDIRKVYSTFVAAGITRPSLLHVAILAEVETAGRNGMSVEVLAEDMGVSKSKLFYALGSLSARGFLMTWDGKWILSTPGACITNRLPEWAKWAYRVYRNSNIPNVPMLTYAVLCACSSKIGRTALEISSSLGVSEKTALNNINKLQVGDLVTTGKAGFVLTTEGKHVFKLLTDNKPSK